MNTQNLKRIVLVSSILFIILFLIVNNSDYYSKRLSLKPHTTGYITLNVNNRKVLINELSAKLEKVNPNGEKINIKLINEHFKIQKGEYGGPYLLLSLNPEFCTEHIDAGLVKGLQIEFGIFNTNWWHQNNIDFTIDIFTQSNGTISVKCLQQITGDEETVIEREFIISIDENTGYESYLIVTVGP